ncbi:MAG: Hpt domain-containing protein [Bdellovibrionales bacterium]
MADLIDHEALEIFLRDEIDNNMKLAYDLLEVFADYTQELENYDVQSTAQNLNRLREMSHRLKSSCHSFGAQALLTELEVLEKVSGSGDYERSKQSLNLAQALSQKTIQRLRVLLREYQTKGAKSA